MFSFGADASHRSGRGRVLRERHQRDARGARPCRRTQPIPDAEKFRVEYWELEERKLRCRPPAPPLRGGWRSSPAAPRGSAWPSPTVWPPRGRAWPSSTSTATAAEKAAADLGADRALGGRRRHRRGRGRRRVRRRGACAFGGVDIVVNNAGFAAAALVDTTVEVWDALHAVLAKGSFLVAAGRGAD